MAKLLLPLLFIFLPVSGVGAGNYNLSPLQEMALALQEVRPLIDEAQRNTDRAERFRFEYKDLISDLAIIHHGLVSAATGREEQGHKPRSLFVQYGYVGSSAESRYLTMLKRELQMIKSEAEALSNAEEGEDEVRRVNYEFIVSDLTAVIDAITVSLIGSGDQPRRFPALRGKGL